MKLNTTLSLLFSLSLYLTYSQSDSIIDKYLNYHNLEKETIFTHINKSTFTNNETLYFQTYVYHNKDSKPFVSSTNIHLNIYDATGNIKSQNIFNANNGISLGQIEIDSTFKNGVYYLETTTNWMKNFRVKNSDLKKITINGTFKTDLSDSEKNKIGIYPEGKNIIKDVTNTIVVKIDNLSEKLKNKKLKGYVLEKDTNTFKTAFSINNEGFGKFTLNPEKGKNYHIIFKHEQEEIAKKDIIKIKEKGINLTVLNKPNHFNLLLQTNSSTLNDLVGKTYNLYIHRDGKIINIPIIFKPNVNVYNIPVEKSKILKGINILSLMDNNKNIVSERLVFNELNLKNTNIKIDEITKTKDSITLKLKSDIIKSSNNFSISILPKDTKSDKFKHSIKSKLFLDPYIKNNSLKGYLNDNDSKSIYLLDLLLISSESKQNLEKSINSKQELLNNFETGFQIKGKLNNYKYKEGDYIKLISPKNGLSLTSKINSNKEFSFDNLFLLKDSEISFELKNKNGKTLKIHPYFNIYPSVKPQKLSIELDQIKEHKNEILDFNDQISDFVLPENVTELDQVELGLVKKEIKTDNEVMSSGMFKKIQIFETANQYQLITDIIRMNGFEVINDGFNVTITSRRARSMTSTFSPAVFIDDVHQGNDLSFLTDLTVADIEEIYISQNVSIYGSLGVGGVIKIYLKKGVAAKKKLRNKIFTVDFGFEIEKPYVIPFYSSTTSSKFNQFGSIFWVSNASFNSEGELKVTFQNLFNQSFKIYLNGMDSDGNLYYKEITIN